MARPADPEGQTARWMLIGNAMARLADTDVGTQAERRGRALRALVELVPADVLTWDSVELALGGARH
jgi:hypothetical protein